MTTERKFSTTTSDRRTRRASTSAPCGVFRSRHRLRLLRCRFCSSEPRRRPVTEPRSCGGGGSTRITSAPQSDSRRTAAGPARAMDRSSTVMPDSGRSADGA
ncbi:hypothetical protein D9M72_494070 [compost metagenome]